MVHVARRVAASITFVLLIASAEAQTIRVSLDSMGIEANGGSTLASLNGDGRFVAFVSVATNLFPGDTNGVTDVFVHDLVSGETVLASVSAIGGPANGNSTSPALSSDGRFVAFVSNSQNLVSPPLAFSTAEVYVRDLVAGTTEIVSLSSTGAPADGDCRMPSLSANARYVAFDSTASNLVVGDFNGAADVFVRDRVAGATERISVNASGAGASGGTASISENGRFVAFLSVAPNIVPEGTGSNVQAVVKDRQTGFVFLASADPSDHPTVVSNRQPTMSADGRFVVFESGDGNLVSGDTNARPDAFLRDLVAARTVRVDLGASGNQLAGGATSPRLTADGRFVVFLASSSDVMPGTPGRATDVFVRDLQAGTTTWTSPSWIGAHLGSDCLNPAISGDGRRTAFETLSILTPNDGNGVNDVFVHATEPFACSSGIVGLGDGTTTDVLVVNGAGGGDARIVSVAPGAPIDVSLFAPRLGPVAPRYVLWIWLGAPTRSYLLEVAGITLGCTAQPTPFQPFGLPQPIRCVRGGLSALVCIGVTELHGPSRAPFTLRRSSGFSNPTTFTLQGMVEDHGTAAPLPFSITNAIVLRVQ
ncbi:MAG: PD40 domain-containing protein [Planctomycetes bacterium]|nr:PD40 domain-containing protein [Planctomycetota bacterium]